MRMKKKVRGHQEQDGLGVCEELESCSGRKGVV